MALRADDVDLGRDRELVVRSQSGDDSAFEDLYRRYFHRLYRFCLRRTHDPHEAEEVAQETFVRAYRLLPDFAGERRFYPWLTVIATRLCVDAQRRQARTTPAATIDLGAVGDTVDDGVVAADDAALVTAALDRLTPRHRDVLRLREQEGWTYRHIAAQMGVSEGTVEALLHRARRALRREFAAVAGPDGRNVVGLGVVGWLSRRLADLRQRVGGWETAWAPAVGNAVAAAVVVVGSAVTVTPVAPSAATNVDAGGVPVAVASDAAVPTEPHVHPHVHPHTHAHSHAHPAQRPEAPAPGTQARTKARPVSAGGVLVAGDEGRDRAEEQPTTGNAGGVIVGADPEAVVEDTAGTTTHYTGWVQQRLGGTR